MSTTTITPNLFPLQRYGYALEKILNNENRWETKIVCSLLNKRSVRCASTTYVNQIDYLKLLETTSLLNSRGKLSPKIIDLYPAHRTVVCDYIGEFLADHLSVNPDEAQPSLGSVFDYLKDIGSINQCDKIFSTPAIIGSSWQLADQAGDNFTFLPCLKTILPQLEYSGVKFRYGYGIEDPHIWNFRIVKNLDGLRALTTDFDYISDRINYFWELGYFYATFRWIKKRSGYLARESERFLLGLIQNEDLKSRFMFWLGVLSSYCGYRDSLRNLMVNGGMSKLTEQCAIIEGLDKKISLLGIQILRPIQRLKQNPIVSPRMRLSVRAS